MRCLDHSEVVTCQKCSPGGNVITIANMPVFNFKKIRDEMLDAYNQGRKDAIDEVLALLNSGEKIRHIECPQLVAEWLEGKLKGSGA